MPDSTSDKIAPRIIPYLYYENVELALRWLSDVFGFQERTAETMRTPDGRVVHAAMELEGGAIMIGSPGVDYRNPKHFGRPTQNLYVYVSNLKEHFERAKRAGAQLLTEITETFYGDHRYGVEDLEGHHWYFGQTAKTVAVADWKPSEQDLKGHT
jgi:uncharacterized glyoxalase superfamily protein PhnB